MEKTFAKHMGSSVFLSRFLATGLGPAVNVLAGLSKTPFRKFLPYVVVGEVLYVVLFLALGYAFGDQWEAISNITQDIGTIIMLVIVLLGLLATLFRVRRARK